jgi:diaminohydroxyphosphoribosylaminopyrimidine deaminase / 5-amino-6-(5-phosphoribosylamino)uracil reductase
MTMDAFMNAAFNIAKTADLNAVRPNPLVGAIVISSEGVIIGEGCHEQFGKAHAEVNAINAALEQKADLSDCTLYVTLEPCSHFGKTPPCTSLIIKHGFKKVVIGSLDPNNLVKGVQVLKDAGIIVELNEYPELIEMNKEFFINKKYNRPYIVLKMAITIDGKIADRNGSSKWISCEESRESVHENFRANADAILTTSSTIIKDDARFNIRKKDGSIFDKNVEVLDRDFRLLDPANEHLSIFSSHPNSFIDLFGIEKKIDYLPKNVRAFFVEHDNKGNILLDSFFKKQLELNNHRLLVEAGSKLATYLLMHDCIDEMNLFMAPIVLPDQQAISLFSTDFTIALSESKRFKLDTFQQSGADIFVRYKRNTNFTDASIS